MYNVGGTRTIAQGNHHHQRLYVQRCARSFVCVGMCKMFALKCAIDRIYVLNECIRPTKVFAGVFINAAIVTWKHIHI